MNNKLEDGEKVLFFRPEESTFNPSIFRQYKAIYGTYSVLNSELKAIKHKTLFSKLLLGMYEEE